MARKEIDDIAAAGLRFDICYDDDGQPIVGDSEGAEFIRRVVDDTNASLKHKLLNYLDFLMRQTFHIPG